jgi:hypothetical protein
MLGIPLRPASAAQLYLVDAELMQQAKTQPVGKPGSKITSRTVWIVAEIPLFDVQICVGAPSVQPPGRHELDVRAIEYSGVAFGPVTLP